MKFVCWVILMMVSVTATANTLIIPTPEKYQDFLIHEWQPTAPNVIVFKDPNCGYCIRALKNLEQYKNYNVFMFWSPILGESSTQKVNDILKCDNPISYQVFNAVINRSALECQTAIDLKKQQRLRLLNNEIVANYNPQSVPSYYFGGQKVYLNSLNRFRQNMAENFISVQLN